MKRQLSAAILAVSLTSAALAGCSSDSGDSSSSSGGDIRIALVMSHMSNSFTTTVANAAVAEGDDRGVEVTVFDGKKDVNTQINLIQSAVTQDYDGIRRSDSA